jgi:hypothetical protein
VILRPGFHGDVAHIVENEHGVVENFEARSVQLAAEESIRIEGFRDSGSER